MRKVEFHYFLPRGRRATTDRLQRPVLITALSNTVAQGICPETRNLGLAPRFVLHEFFMISAGLLQAFSGMIESYELY